MTLLHVVFNKCSSRPLFFLFSRLTWQNPNFLHIEIFIFSWAWNDKRPTQNHCTWSHFIFYLNLNKMHFSIFPSVLSDISKLLLLSWPCLILTDELSSIFTELYSPNICFYINVQVTFVLSFIPGSLSKTNPSVSALLLKFPPRAFIFI